MTRSIRSRLRVRQIILGTLLACSPTLAAQTLEFQLHDAWGREIRRRTTRAGPCSWNLSPVGEAAANKRLAVSAS